MLLPSRGLCIEHILILSETLDGDSSLIIISKMSSIVTMWITQLFRINISKDFFVMNGFPHIYYTNVDRK